MVVPPPPCPAARRRGIRVLPTGALSLLLLSAFAVGCYAGPNTPDGDPWEGLGDDDEGDDGDGGSDGSSGGGEADGGDSADAGDSADGGDTATADGGDSATADGGDSATADGGDSADGGTGDDGADTGVDDPEVPDNSYCMEVSDWDPGWSTLETQILDIVNMHRANGYNCGSQGSFGPAGPLTMQPALRCAARKHSKDMNDRNFFDHTNPSGESPGDRIVQAGYSFSTWGENIAGGSPDAAGTMNQWMGSDGHCANIMNPNFTEIGVGYYPGGQWGTLWTQAFGRP